MAQDGIRTVSELEVTVGGNYANDGTEDDFFLDDLEIPILGTRYTRSMQALSVTPAPLDLSSVDMGGYAVIINRGSERARYASSVSAQSLIQVEPGEFAIFRTSTESPTPHVWCDAATTNIEFWLFPP